MQSKGKKDDELVLPTTPTNSHSLSTMPPKKKRVKVESEDEDPDFILSPEKSKPNKSPSKSSKATNSIPDKSQSSLKSFFSPAGTSNPPSNPFKSSNKPNKKPKLSQERDEDLEWAINESLKMAAAATQDGDDKGIGGSSKPLFLPDADDLDQDDDLDLNLEDQEMEEVEGDENKAGKGKAEQSSNQIIEILDSDDDETSSSTSQCDKSKKNSKEKGKKKEDSGYGGSSEEGSPSTINSKLPQVQEEETGDFVSCPSCNKEIKSQDAQNHVNACLDELMEEKPQSKTASRKKSTSPLKAEQDEQGSSKQASSSDAVDLKKSTSKSSLESTLKKNLNSSSTSCTPSDPSIPMKPISELASLFTKQTSSSSSDNQTSINPEPKAATPSTSSNPTKNAPANAFTKLMTSHLHTKEWLSADAVEAQNSTRKGKNRARREGNVMAPFYKILEGMPICVDGFRFGEIKGCEAFFLTHFHS